MSIEAIGGWLIGWSESQLSGIIGVSRPMMSAAVRAGLGQGLSANQMLDILKGQGLGVRRQDFLDIVRNAKASQRSESMAMSYNLGDVPTMGTVPEVQLGNLTGYVHQVDITSTQTLDGVRQQITKRFYLRTDEPITVQEATVRARQVFDQAAVLEQYEGQRFLYAQYAGVVHVTPARRT